MIFKKNILKAIGILTLVSITVFAFKSSNIDSENSPETVMIKMFDAPKNVLRKQAIKIYKGDGEIEKVDIKEWRDFIKNQETIDENYDDMLAIVNDYKSKGYSVLSHTEVFLDGRPDTSINTFVLSKN